MFSRILRSNLRKSHERNRVGKSELLRSITGTLGHHFASDVLKIIKIRASEKYVSRTEILTFKRETT
ncbi:hypothetical protein KC353_g11 [Hortaea werneckii]|nr:hypothetical protein KC353_g11 [Hortaea werneckii]